MDWKESVGSDNLMTPVAKVVNNGYFKNLPLGFILIFSYISFRAAVAILQLQGDWRFLSGSLTTLSPLWGIWYFGLRTLVHLLTIGLWWSLFKQNKYLKTLAVVWVLISIIFLAWGSYISLQGGISLSSISADFFVGFINPIDFALLSPAIYLVIDLLTLGYIIKKLPTS